jgi:hypothetical protein
VLKGRILLPVLKVRLLEAKAGIFLWFGSLQGVQSKGFEFE